VLVAAAPLAASAVLESLALLDVAATSASTTVAADDEGALDTDVTNVVDTATLEETTDEGDGEADADADAAEEELLPPV